MKIDIEDHLIKSARMNRDAGKPLTIEEIAALSKDIQKQNIEAELVNQLSLVGYTNGNQVLYALHDDDAGKFIGDKKNNFCIPLYMLKRDENKIQSTSNSEFILEAIKALRKKRSR